ncbi:helix-turn-helix domain-containing protein [Streptomyces sp. NPDC088719]|uniref:helix-turn-helix domain-containing protein n=1 Tax=Streptomyces sp. NPDC088719 TaxID=3365872 RepID=UPI00381201D3
MVSDRGALTVAELVQHGVLPEAVLYGAAGRGTEIRAVRIVDELGSLERMEPRAAIVLTGRVAEAGWTVETALRKAWEQAAACVVVARSPVHTESVGELAERLGVPLLVVREPALDAAVRIASAVAQPEAGRTALVAGAARRLAAAGPHATAVVAALHAVLPATDVALADATGVVLAGRGAALGDDAGREGKAVRVQVPVPDPDRPDKAVLATLHARSRSRAVGWAGTVTAILELAVAPLTAWAATRRLAAERSGHASALLLGRLLEPSEPEAGDSTLAEAVGLGWPVTGPFVVYALRPVASWDGGPDPGPGLAALWAARAGGAGPLVAQDGCWVAWQSLPPDDERDGLPAAETRLRSALPAIGAYVPVAGGVAGPAAGLTDLAAALADARAAAGVAASGVPGTVLRADRLGAAQLFAALPADTLRGPARAVLGPLLEADRDRVLLRTLATVLDTGAALSAAATTLGVHRNTVASRLDRIKALGFDPDDPAQRLALHLACRVLLSEGGDGSDAPPDG